MAYLGQKRNPLMMRLHERVQVLRNCHLTLLICKKSISSVCQTEVNLRLTVSSYKVLVTNTVVKYILKTKSNFIQTLWYFLTELMKLKWQRWNSRHHRYNTSYLLTVVFQVKFRKRLMFNITQNARSLITVQEKIQPKKKRL